jgi:fatty acid desaturase
LEAAVRVLVIGLIVFMVFFVFLLNQQVLAFFMQLLLLVVAVLWGVRAYFVARAEIEKGITPACSTAERSAVRFLTAEPGWRFRFYNQAYAEQFRAANPGSSLTPWLI